MTGTVPVIERMPPRSIPVTIRHPDSKLRGAPRGCDRHTVEVTTTGQDLLEEFRRQRRAGDPRLTDGDKEIFRRIAMGDLADEFADSLEAISAADPLLGGGFDPVDD